MAECTTSRLPDWLCMPVSSLFCFLSSPPHSMGRQLRGPRQALIAFHSTLLLTLLSTGASSEWSGCWWKKGNRAAFKWREENKTKPENPPNQHTHEHTQMSGNLKVYSKWLKWNSSGPGKKFTFW